MGGWSLRHHGASAFARAAGFTASRSCVTISGHTPFCGSSTALARLASVVA